MSRIVAIDYGRKRTGIAVSDTMQLIANGLTTVPTHELLNFIGDYVAQEPVERIIIGLPKQMNNEVSENMKNIEPFVRSLKRRFPEIPVEYVDERFTSVLAHRTMLEAGLKKKDRIFTVTKSYLHHEMDRGAKEAGVKRIRIHDLRHSHISLLIDMGFSAVAIADRVGHESIEITYRYAHLFPSKQTEMADKLDFERTGA